MSEVKVKIVKPKARNYRKRNEYGNEGENEGEDDNIFFFSNKNKKQKVEDDTTKQTLEDARLELKLRKRASGISAEDLMKGERKKSPSPVPEDDPYKLKTGGLVDGEKKEKFGSLQNSFTAQSKALDVDKHMAAYIENEMKKRKGVQEDTKNQKSADPLSQLYQIPENLKTQKPKTTEENVTISSTMLTAIPEVDLGIEAKLKNIMETEKAKQKFLDERQKQMGSIETPGEIDKKRFQSVANPDKDLMATDDAVLERWKKNFHSHGRR